MNTRRVGQVMAALAIVVGVVAVALGVVSSDPLSSQLLPLLVVVGAASLLVATWKTPSSGRPARISVFRLVAIAIVCGAALLTGLSALVFGASIEIRLMGALFSLVVLGLLAVIAMARSSPSG